MKLNSRFSELNTCLILAIDSKVKALRATGVDVCGFGIGEPDLDTPQHVKAAACDALQAGFTKYTASSGMPELRQAVAEKFLKDNQLEYKPSQIIISNGARQSCVHTIMAVCNDGDEVIIPSPYWITYPEMVRIANAVPVFVRTKEENAWKITAEEFERAITPRTKLIIINTPSNPTGSIYTKDELRAIYEVAAKNDVFILSDEIYERFIYEGAQHFSIAALTSRAYDITITINGFSKAYAMTGWRLGYLGASESVVKIIDSIQSNVTGNPCSFSQKGGIAALRGDQQCVTNMRNEFDIRRRYMFDRIQTIKGVSAVKPFGAFYMLMDIHNFGLSSKVFSERLLNEAHVSVAPGIAFGDDRTVRLSYATGMDTIKKGLDRIEDFCKKLELPA
jgi:aspartate aminotransferase